MALFVVGIPGLEVALEAEMRGFGFDDVVRLHGGVSCAGDLPEAVRANMSLRCAVRVLWRVAEFRAMHLAQLDKRARKVAWADFLRADVPVRVEAACHKSRIYHDKAAAQRVATAIEAAGMTVVAGAADAAVVVKARIEDDLCTISVDTTGEALHRRGHKEFVGKAPLRETMAAAFLRELGFDGRQVVVDPMCGSGTIPLEAADMASGRLPGRSRAFAFDSLMGAVRPEGGADDEGAGGGAGRAQFYGYDRNDGAIRGALANAARAGLSEACVFERQAISELQPPEGPPGIVLVNPPYGGRIGERKLLFGLYGALGEVLKTRFSGWAVGIVTTDKGLARATGLALEPFGPVSHGGMKVTLWVANGARGS